jgi:hypothetical protein
MKSDFDFDFEDLVGEELDFYGVDEQRFRLGDVTYEVVEGKRGFHIEVSDTSIEGLPIARIFVDHGSDKNSFDLVDLHEGDTLLSFGIHSVTREFYFDDTPKDPDHV